VSKVEIQAEEQPQILQARVARLQNDNIINVGMTSWPG